MRVKTSIRTALVASVVAALGAGGFVSPAGAITGGEETAAPESWAVSLQGADGHYCGGTLVAPEWVLTAGHCSLKPDDNSPWVPERMVIGNLSISEGGTVAHAEAVYPHPTAEFTKDENGNPRFSGTDLGLIKLTEPVAERPAPLNEHTPDVATDMRLLGWGYAGDDENGEPIMPDRLREVVLPVVKSGGDSDKIGFQDPDGRGAGAGDSGGPGVVRVADSWVLAGVASSAGRDGQGVTHSNYTDVARHVDWIRSVIQAG
ncbi:S1 family peptidase [Nocardiopsis sediminis]|uniref:S1 family peptidase n=2 Tax=Nocardiopsis sediminis TaxID=1778267 RepID=A0ABV8FRZ3_9ACTN